MAVITKEAILSAEDLPRELVAVPEWNGEVWVRGMSGAERDQWEGDMIDQRGQNMKVNLLNARAKLAARTICDEAGNRLFADNEIAALGKKSSRALQRVWDVAQRLSGISQTDVEELTKN